jgi:hypothetical protein
VADLPAGGLDSIPVFTNLSSSFAGSAGCTMAG